jgi:glutamyl/glutaminyl-tRNA synthetase
VAEFRAKGYLPEALANYLALIGWSPGEGDELLPLEELARRFDLAAVGHSAGVFDEAKLAWVNRHYLKLAAPARLEALAWPHLLRAGVGHGEPSAGAADWLRDVLPPLVASVDRLTEVPDRMRLIFGFDAPAALGLEAVRVEASEPLARAVVAAWAEALRAAPRLTSKDAFRAIARQVGAATGTKGKALFHTIRLAVTGEPDGPELDVLIPAIERAADFTAADGLAPVPGCRERAAAFAAALAETV